MVSAEELPSLLETYERESRHVGVPDEAAAREHLLGMVTGAIERLDTRLKQHAVRDQLQSLLADHLNAVDTSREGVLMRRYEQTCERTLFQVINELKERQAAAADYRRQAFLLPEFRPSASLLTALRSSSELNNDAELAESDGDHDGGGEAQLEVQVARDGLVEGEHLVRNEASRGLGGCAEAGSGEEDGLRNEASRGVSGCAETGSGEEDGLRNEASRAEVDVPLAGSEEGSGLRNEPSSVARVNSEPHFRRRGPDRKGERDDGRNGREGGPSRRPSPRGRGRERKPRTSPFPDGP